MGLDRMSLPPFKSFPWIKIRYLIDQSVANPAEPDSILEAVQPYPLRECVNPRPALSAHVRSFAVMYFLSFRRIKTDCLIPTMWS